MTMLDAPVDGPAVLPDDPPLRRLPWWRQGSEPDYRFSLANERTFLAWIRTALSLMAGGVLMEQFATTLQPRAVLVAVAIGLALLSCVLCGIAYLKWRANEIAMRHGRALPGTVAIPLIAVALVAAAAAVAVLQVVHP